MSLYRLLTIGDQCHRVDRRRVWAEPGVPLIIGPRLTLCVRYDRTTAFDDAWLVDAAQQYEYTLHVSVRGPGVEFDAGVPPGAWVDLTGWAGMLAIQRAEEIDARARPRRALLEFVRTRHDVRWAL